MRFLTLISPALFAATIFAADADSASSSFSSASADASSSASASESSSSATESSSTPLPEPTPIGAIWQPKWTDKTLSPFKTRCHSVATITAEQFKLKDMYPTLKDFAPQLKVFYNKQHYPGSWKGEDKHGNERHLLKMEKDKLPYGVREWISKNKKQRWFSVHEEGFVFFAPGAIYPLVPMFVDEADGKECDGVFDDLESYSTEAKDDAVLGKVEYQTKGDREVEITIEAFQVKAKEEQARDEL